MNFLKRKTDGSFSFFKTLFFKEKNWGKSVKTNNQTDFIYTQLEPYFWTSIDYFGHL